MAESGAAAYYRAIADGNWSATTTWEASTDSGATWVAATGIPGDTADIQDTVYSLTDGNGVAHTVIYDYSMVGSITFDDLNTTAGTVILPSTDPGVDLVINGGLLKFINFDLTSQTWRRAITVNLDGNRLYHSSLKDDSPLYVAKIVSEASTTEKVLKLFDLRRKKFVEDVSGTELQTGQTVWYSNTISDTISAVSYDATSKSFAVTLTNGITTLGLGDFVAIETQRIKIYSQNYAGLYYAYSQLNNVFINFTGTSTTQVAANALHRPLFKIFDSLIIADARSYGIVGDNLFVALGSSLGTVYGFYMVTNSFIGAGTLYYCEQRAYYSILRQNITSYYGKVYSYVDFVAPATVGFSNYYSDRLTRVDHLTNVEAVTVWFGSGVFYDGGLFLDHIDVAGEVTDFIFYDNTGYMQRAHSNGYWEAIGDSWYLWQGNYRRNYLSFWVEGVGEIKVLLYKEGALILEKTYSVDGKQYYAFNSDEYIGDLEVFIFLPDGFKLWADEIESACTERHAVC